MPELADNFSSCKITVETLIPGGAEWAGNRATCLAGDAKGSTVVFGNEDRFHRVAHADVKQPLPSSVCRQMLGADWWRRHYTAFLKSLTKISGEIRHFIEIGNAALVDPALQLLCTKRLATPLRDEFGQRGGIHSQQIGAGYDSWHNQLGGKRFQLCLN